MKVVTKFAVAFFVVSALCLGLFSYGFAKREATRIERTLARGLTGYGVALRPTLEAAWAEHGLAAAERIVQAFQPEGEVTAKLVGSEGSAPLSQPRNEIVDEQGRRLVRVTLPVTGPRGAQATLLLERSVVDGSTIIRDELGDQMIATAILAVVMAALAAVLGAILIGQPLNRIVAQARRIGEGDLTHRLRATRTDEIGVLKRELNAMCDRLEAANARVEEEATARIETLEKLRHLDRLRTVGTLASGIAHELGTPLNVLLLRGQSLANGDVEPSEMPAAGAAVVNQVEQMSRMVRQPRGFARTRGALETRRERVDLAGVARHAPSLLGSLAKKHGVAIAVESDDDVAVHGDFGQIEQALTNLIVNGIQAMPKGGRLDVRVLRKPGTGGVVIEVRDEGTGMPPEVAQRVFDPFYTTKPEGEGTGLGLHVARGIVEEHGGSIRARSEVGKGSTFELHLPGAS